MKSKRLLMMLLVAFLLPLATFAQTAQSLPYSYGMETLFANSGWTKIGGNASGATNGNAIHVGNYGFQFGVSSTNPYNGAQYLVSPELDGTDGIWATFWYRNYNANSNGYFKWGYTSQDVDFDNFDATAFTWVNNDAITPSDYVWHQVETFVCPAGTKYVAVSCEVVPNGTATSGYAFVDDFSFVKPTAKALDYTYGFETALENEGWTTYNANVYNKAWQTKIATGNAKHEGDYGFQFWGSVTGGQYLISPELSGTGNGVAMDFWYQVYSTTGQTFQVGYSITTNETTAFDFGNTTFTANNAATSQGGTGWAQLDQQVFPAGTKYVVIKFTGTSYFFIDDISITEAPECEAPTNLQVSSLGTTSATVTWEGVAETYGLSYQQTSANGWTTLTTNHNEFSYTIPNLTPGTTYTVRVVSICTSGESVPASITFTTDCEAVTLPYSYGFEDSESSKWNCWEKETGISVATGYAVHGGSKGLQFFNASESTFVSPVLNGTENGVAFYFYYGVFSGTQTFKVGYCVNNQWTWTNNISASNVTNPNNNPEWLQYYKEDIPANTTQVAIKCTSLGYFFVDDISITEAPSCQAPTNLTVSDVTSTGATLAWEGGGSTFGIDYRPVSGNWLTTTLTHTGGYSYTLNNLTPNTTYQARVLSNCGDGESGWSNTVEFTTECGAYAIPYTYGFEDANDYICWTPEGASTTYRTTSNAAHTGNYVFQFFNNASNTYSEQYLYTPELVGNGTNQIGLSFWYRNWYSYYNTSFQVGHKANENDNFTWKETVNVSGAAWTEYLTVLPANTKYVAIKCSVFNPGTGDEPTTPDNSWFLLDDFSFQYAFTKDIVGYNNISGDANEVGWYLIASPVSTTVTPTEANGFLANTYDLYRFNQSAEDEWENWKQEGDHYQFNIESGKGYLYANSETVTLQFVGVPYEGEGTFELDFDGDSEEFAGWNLVGNPFNAEVNVDRDYYRIENPEESREIIVGYGTVAAMEGIFVKATEEGQNVTFNLPNEGSTPANCDAMVVMNLIQNRGNVIDRAIVRFGNDNKLPKFMLNPENTKMYIPQNGKDYAIAAAEEAQGEMPVNFKARENGTYTLTVNPENVEMAYLHLIDNMTGTDIDLLSTPSYTFNATTRDYESRFRLVFSANGENGASTGSATFAFISDGNLIVNNEGEATLQVVDVTGRVLSSETIDGSCSTELNVPAGVYMIRLVNGNNVKVQKVVVR